MAGVICGHSRDGVVPGRSTMSFLPVLITPLVPAWMIRSRVGARKKYVCGLGTNRVELFV